MLISSFTNPFRCVVGTNYPIQQKSTFKQNFHLHTNIQKHFQISSPNKQRSFSFNRKINSNFESKSNQLFWLILGAAGGLVIQQLFEDKNTKEKAQSTALALSVEENSPDKIVSETLKNFSFQSAKEVYEIPPIFPATDLYSIGGYESLLQEITEYVLYLQNPNEYTKDGTKPPKGFILSGPPGVGKTALAQSIAGHAGVPLFVINAGNLPRVFVGQVEKALKEVFNEASKHTPCVIFIDELDSVGAKRMDTTFNEVNAQHHNNGVNQLLTLLSDTHSGIVVIGATNFFEKLDPALVRPGRFDKHLVMTLPSQTERRKILTHYLKNKTFNVNIEDLASISAGFSGAQLEGWVDAAALYAKKMKNSTINTNHFDLARTTILFGVPHNENANPTQKNSAAIHEAGHALVGHLLNLKLHKASVIKRGNHNGFVEWIPENNMDNPTKVDLLNKICAFLAGIAAEKLSGNVKAGRKSDIENAKAIAMQIISEGMGSTLLGRQQEVETILEDQLSRAVKLLEENIQTWEKIRDALIEKDELLSEDFLKIIANEDTQTKSKWWWNNCETSSKAIKPPFALPPKKAYVPKSETLTVPAKVNVPQPIEKKNEALKFSINEIAKALGVDADRIREIKYISGSYNITFKPSFENSDINKIGDLLEKNDIENTCFPYSKVITVDKKGVEDFEKFVKKKNSFWFF